MLLTSSNLAGISHGFFTRQGGVSEGIYASLNCGRGSKDNKEHVAENRRRVAEKMGTEPTKLCTLYQIHSADVITVQEPVDNPLPKADAMVTKTPGLALGILTADCVPVLFTDQQAGVIGAAHAGWRGTLTGVLEATIKAMQALGAEPSRISAAIGPAIAAVSYEVGSEVRDAFLQRQARFAEYFIPHTQGHFHFDLKGLVRGNLAAAGISSINLLENDTYLEEDAFFSFRRTTHRGEADYGRQISAIMLGT